MAQVELVEDEILLHLRYEEAGVLGALVNRLYKDMVKSDAPAAVEMKRQLAGINAAFEQATELMTATANAPKN